ncbi:hypothetical protein Tco_0225989 [Tanacetum coccineum]
MQWKNPSMDFHKINPHFSHVLDAIALTYAILHFSITCCDVLEVYMNQFWNCIYKHDDFYRFKIDKKKHFKLMLEVFREILHICPRVQGRDFDPLPSEEDIVPFLRDLGHNKSYLERRLVLTSFVSPEYKSFRVAGLKAAIKFKKASPSKKDNVPIPEDEEPVKKGKRLKTAAKKSAYKPATGIVIRQPVVETKSKRKEKEKVDVAHGKGIELLSDVALSEEAQIKEVRKKSLRDFHKTHPSGSGMVAEDPLSVAKITSPITSEGTGDILGVPDVTNDNSSESESEFWGNDEDDNNEEHISSDEGSEEENESDKQASDSEQEEESEDDDQEENKDDDDLD